MLNCRIKHHILNRNDRRTLTHVIANKTCHILSKYRQNTVNNDINRQVRYNNTFTSSNNELSFLNKVKSVISNPMKPKLQILEDTYKQNPKNQEAFTNYLVHYVKVDPLKAMKEIQNNWENNTLILNDFTIKQYIKAAIKSENIDKVNIIALLEYYHHYCNANKGLGVNHVNLNDSAAMVGSAAVVGNAMNSTGNPSMNPSINPAINSSIHSNFNPLINPNSNSALNSSYNSSINSSMNTSNYPTSNPTFNPLIHPSPINLSHIFINPPPGYSSDKPIYITNTPSSKQQFNNLISFLFRLSLGLLIISIFASMWYNDDKNSGAGANISISSRLGEFDLVIGY